MSAIAEKVHFAGHAHVKLVLDIGMWVTELGMWDTGYELSTRNGDLPDFCCSFKFSNKKKTFHLHFKRPK